MPGESVQRHVCLGTTVVSSPLEPGADQAPLLLDQLQGQGDQRGRSSG